MKAIHYACPSHCCIRHGCKYGHDDCPVTTGEVKQQFPCEDCHGEPDPLTADERATVEELRADAARQVQGYPRLLRALAILDAHFPPPVKG